MNLPQLITRPGRGIIVGAILAGLVIGWISGRAFVSSRGEGSNESPQPERTVGRVAGSTKAGQLLGKLSSVQGIPPAYSTEIWNSIADMDELELRAALLKLERMEMLSDDQLKLAGILWEEWSQRSPSTAFDHLIESGFPRGSGSALGLIFSSWAEKDPEAAATAAELLPQAGMQSRRGQAWAAICKHLASTDPERALEICQLAGDRREQVTESVYQLWAKQAPSVAAAHLLASGPKLDRGAMRAIIGEWAVSDSDAALSWVDGNVPQPMDRRQIISSLLENLSRENPQEALRHVGLLSTAHSRRLATEGAVYNWALEDRESALEWTATLESPTERINAERSILDAISSTDPELAAELADSLPGRQMSEEAFRQYAARRAGDPESALDWAATLEDKRKRTAAIEVVTRQWARSDPWAVAEFAAQSQGRPEAGMVSGIAATNLIQTDVAGTVTWTAELPEATREEVARLLLEQHQEQLDREQIAELSGFLSSPLGAN